MKVHIIQHDFWVEPGEYTAWANRRGHEVSYTKCWKYDCLPENIHADMLIILGGLQCPATTPDECDYFDAAAEKRLIRKYIDAGKMVVGVCLGAQLIGEALGAAYQHSPEREIGPVLAKLTEAGRADLLFLPKAMDVQGKLYDMEPMYMVFRPTWNSPMISLPKGFRMRKKV